RYHWYRERRRCCILNRAAAGTCQPDDQIIICNSIYLDEVQITSLKPRIVTFDQDNPPELLGRSRRTWPIQFLHPSRSERGFGHSSPGLRGVTCP
ncbi:MAG: hypothetical protein E5V36_01055, partial [Mesorhizobium sp.]